ncbi:MAG: peptide deformylase [Christensenellales bacterium]|jgi:peptide deformylase
MAIRDLVTGADNPELRKILREVRIINKHVLTLLDDMKETLHAAQGVGLAAPQVGVLRRIAIVEFEDKYYELINPRILKSSGGVIGEEGCLSVPGVRGKVKRPETITVTYLDRAGKRHKEEITGILARVFCHEIDHLDGVLFVDKMIEETE